MTSSRVSRRRRVGRLKPYRWRVSDGLWEQLAPLLADPPRRFRSPGRLRHPPRACLEGILYVLFTDTPWLEVPYREEEHREPNHYRGAPLTRRPLRCQNQSRSSSRRTEQSSGSGGGLDAAAASVEPYVTVASDRRADRRAPGFKPGSAACSSPSASEHKQPSKPVRSCNPRLGRFDSCAAPFCRPPGPPKKVG
jgi:transposase